MAKITINEGLTLLKSLQERHAELSSLRNENGYSTTRHYGVGGDKSVTKEPTYDVVKLDSLITKVATAKRKLEAAIKKANASVDIPGYDWDESVMGEVSLAALPPKPPEKTS